MREAAEKTAQRRAGPPRRDALRRTRRQLDLRRTIIERRAPWRIVVSTPNLIDLFQSNHTVFK
jgi:hypothetical protein